MLITCMSIVAFTLLLTNGGSFANDIMEYFLCESIGIRPGNPCPRNYESYVFGKFLVVDLAVLALYPLYILIFVINFQEVKKFLSCHSPPQKNRNNQ